MKRDFISIEVEELERLQQLANSAVAYEATILQMEEQLASLENIIGQLLDKI